MVRQGDDRWFNLVRWTQFALLDAEELGVTSANVEAMRASNNPDIARLLGADNDFSRAAPRPGIGSAASSRRSAITAKFSSEISGRGRR